MKKVFTYLLASLLAVAFAACTEKEKIENTPETPPEQQHNSLYQSVWAGTAQRTVSVPIVGDVTLTLDNTVNFLDDSNASCLISFDAAALYSKDSTVTCTYTWTDPNGVLTAVKDPSMSIAFQKVNSTTINITLTKADITTMWPAMGYVESYLPESFSIDLIKQ